MSATKRACFFVHCFDFLCVCFTICQLHFLFSRSDNSRVYSERIRYVNWPARLDMSEMSRCTRLILCAIFRRVYSVQNSWGTLLREQCDRQRYPVKTDAASAWPHSSQDRHRERPATVRQRRVCFLSLSSGLLLFSRVTPTLLNHCCHFFAFSVQSDKLGRKSNNNQF